MVSVECFGPKTGHYQQAESEDMFDNSLKQSDLTWPLHRDWSSPWCRKSTDATLGAC